MSIELCSLRFGRSYDDDASCSSFSFSGSVALCGCLLLMWSTRKGGGKLLLLLYSSLFSRRRPYLLPLLTSKTEGRDGEREPAGVILPHGTVTA